MTESEDRITGNKKWINQTGAVCMLENLASS
jgi:hypothetical protein